MKTNGKPSPMKPMSKRLKVITDDIIRNNRPHAEYLNSFVADNLVEGILSGQLIGIHFDEEGGDSLDRLAGRKGPQKEDGEPEKEKQDAH